MARGIRLTTVLTLLVTFLVTSLIPATGSWSCPDGTACVYTPGRGFHCLGDRCQMPCCMARRSGHRCSRCDHGAIPGCSLSRRIASSSSSHERTVGEPAHCLFHENGQAQTAWMPVRTAPDLQWHAVALLPAPVELPVAARSWVSLAPTRGSPPPSHSTPSSSPRAPPGPHCA